MSRKFRRRGAAAVFALALFVTPPAHAAGLSDWVRFPTLLHQAWQWLDSMLPGGAVSRPECRSGQGSIREKVLPGADPTGASASSTSTEAEKGAGVDPNG
jgi:hypothetical protein